MTDKRIKLKSNHIIKDFVDCAEEIPDTMTNREIKACVTAFAHMLQKPKLYVSEEEKKLHIGLFYGDGSDDIDIKIPLQKIGERIYSSTYEYTYDEVESCFAEIFKGLFKGRSKDEKKELQKSVLNALKP